MTGADGVASMGVVTDLGRAGDAGDSAAAVADRAATAAGVLIREITDLTELDAVYRLYDGIWRPDPKNPPVTTELLRALTKAGNYVAGAFDGPTLVGACVGFFGAPAAVVLHSHIAGVSPAALGSGVGFALKLHQRAWALLRGVSVIEWTFDPLVSRNAYFNLVKLAAAPAEYLPNFYGDMRDGINGSDDTDRLLVRWDLTAPAVVAACAGAARPVDAAVARAHGAMVGLSRSAHGLPVLGDDAATGTVLVAVPHDIEALRAAAPGCSRSPAARTRPTRPGWRPSWAARCRRSTRG